MKTTNTWRRRLRQRRRKLEMSQTYLAEKLGYYGPSVVSDWERGRRRGPTPEVFARMCLELGVSADWLLGLSNDP